LKNEIHGHICCNPNPKETLSLQRAKAVFSFLVANDIEKSRMSFLGFGSSQPIFPLPENNETERATNRRVEIKVVDK
jgi:outer membrane protein OmpA-like peptidoglycan-associated protein